MIPRVVLDTAELPDGGGTLRLVEHGGGYTIMLGTNGLMSSRLSGSEEELARIGCGRIAGRPAPAVLIGGLGMGFTLRAALRALPADARVTVAELIPEVIAWARGPLAPVFDGILDDPRARVVEGDVATSIAGTASAWDSILLDVDNGPDGLTIAANDWLYGPAGLRAARAALRPGGVLGIWSAASDDAFARRLRQAGFAVEEVVVRARVSRGARHVLWFATR